MLALRERGVRDTDVLRAMEQVPRERFAPAPYRAQARRDIALPLPCGQTMTAPTVIAAMLTALGVGSGLSVLEIGTGSGYVTALLLRLGAVRVHSIERYATLVEDARGNLGSDARAHVEPGDGLAALGGLGTFDRILVNGALTAFPTQLVSALAPGGRLVGALGRAEASRLAILECDAAGLPILRLGAPLRIARLTPGRAAVF